MTSPAHSIFGLEAAHSLRPAASLTRPLREPAWDLAYLAGKLVELRGVGASAVLTAGLGLVRGAQEMGEMVVWVTSLESLFFPVDGETWGLDLHALAVVRVPGDRAILEATDRLAHSGAFGLIVLDFVSLLSLPSVSLSQQSRLLGLAQKHETALVFLTAEERLLSVSGSLVSLRSQVERRALGAGRYAVSVSVLKDKQSGPGWHHEALCWGPPGLC